jgi:RNA polymerase sigma-70 factor (ECF subfamily)
MDDAALVRQVLAGQTEAYAELVRRWAGRVRAVCLSRTGKPDAADDLAQEALLRGLEELASLAAPERFGPWLVGIALNASRDWLKSKDNTALPLSQVAAPSGNGFEGASRQSGPEAVAEHTDELGRLRAEVEVLPEELRTALMLYYTQGLTYRELAHLLDVSPATVNARLTRARLQMRARLKAPVVPAQAPALKGEATVEGPKNGL